MIRATKSFLVAGFMTLVIPALAVAQVCVGVPTRDGDLAFSGTFGITDGAKIYGIGANADVTGPLSLEVGYSLITYDDLADNANSFHAGIGLELPGLNFSACPFAGLQYSILDTQWFGIDVGVRQTVGVVGFGIGKSFAIAPEAQLGLYTVPQFLYLRARITATDGVFSESETNSETEFGASLGFRLASRSFFGGAAVSFSTIEDSDPVFTVTLGIITSVLGVSADRARR
jgi:hypothetical protein